MNRNTRHNGAVRRWSIRRSTVVFAAVPCLGVGLLGAIPAAAQKTRARAVSAIDPLTVTDDPAAWRIATRSNGNAWLDAADDSWGTDTPLPGARRRPRTLDSASLSLPDIDSPLIDFAATLLGRRYRFGASSGAFDCSGFVKRVYAKFGVDLPHSSAQQFTLGRGVDRHDLQAGDLVFFRTGRRGGVSHVGLYAGVDLFVHAARSAGRVRVDSLTEDYFATRYAGARRLCSGRRTEC